MLGLRILAAVRKEPDWTAMTPDRLATLRDAENRRRSSPLIRVVTGFPARGVRIGWRDVALPDRVVRTRVYRPSAEADAVRGGRPLVLHVHGGGFVGTAVQSDWINSHIAARLRALVVSVEHRLLSFDTPLAAMVEDGWDVLRHVLTWDEVDPGRVAVFGESAGGTVAAMAALRAGPAIRAQVLVNPCVDVTPSALGYPSMREHADSPTLTLPQMTFFLRLAVPEGADPRAVSPLYAGDADDLAPALVVVPTLDPVADQGWAYARRLRDAGVPVNVAEHPGAPHAFVSTPGLVSRARVARAEIIDFLRARLGAQRPQVRRSGA
ncbi:alpha/beta hydrolase [Paractinoplanes deccanensis]|uniref:Alpha/beta hydrolase n=1 Tax=Paractinoplanes deccanensis TaxID=113561 RepID=A0ABQ3YAZ9_9ACTN|nr:alpha/beta hydrolase [Actinoplanes deccanensis]GID77158.1 alpha/beta hydrolase [Actinoplanes deccanensis]